MPKLPKKIAVCPIVEAILEIRFSSSLPEDAIFGVLYNHIKDDYPKFEQLPILQLPAALRAQDPNMLYSPHYKAKKDNLVVQIGPRIFSISNVKTYAGWDEFSEKIYTTFERVQNSGVINNIERIGLRYINILKEVNIFENSNFIASLNNDVLMKKTNITTEVAFKKGICRLTATSDAEAQLGGAGGEKILGSVIDIDALVNPRNFNGINEAIEYAHDIEKELFFTILKEDFIKTLKPEY